MPKWPLDFWGISGLKSLSLGFFLFALPWRSQTWLLQFLHSREEQSVHYHHRKKIFWRTFLASKKNFPGRWWIRKPYKNQENHVHHRNLSSVDPIFCCKEKFCTGAGRCMLSFSQHRCALLHAFALFCVLVFAYLRLHSFALTCAFLHAFACFCVRLRFNRPLSRIQIPDRCRGSYGSSKNG